LFIIKSIISIITTKKVEIEVTATIDDINICIVPPLIIIY